LASDNKLARSMPHASPLIATIVGGIGLAFILGTIANRLRISPLVGYLLAGVAVGPFTPGFVADAALAPQLAEIGVILLMFGVGLHFSVKDLMAIRATVIPGAIAQVGASTCLGWFLAWLLGSSPAGPIFGVALSVASTVVLMRALQERHLVDTDRGHVVVGWLIVQDMLMVIVLVLLPPLAALVQQGGGGGAAIDYGSLAASLGITLAKVAAFVGLMLLVGRRAIPMLLHYIAHTGSRELFRLAVLSVALGVAFVAAELFDVSFALGAFFAGMTLSESELSQAAAEESLPFRDAFAVLFFVSVGMLFDPAILVRDPVGIGGVVFLVLVANPCLGFVAARLFGAGLDAALLLAAGIAQIGEFSFILADLGIRLGALDESARHLVLAASILSIVVNPLFFAVPDRLLPRLRRRPSPAVAAGAVPSDAPLAPTRLTDHAVLIGYGRVGRLVAEGLAERGWPILVIEDVDDAFERAKAGPGEVIQGNAADDRVLAAANLSNARMLLVAIPNAFEAGQIVEQARAANPGLEIVARAHFDAEVEHLLRHGADIVIMGEREIARSMLERAARQVRTAS
jgi:CPA2 family monovalent cation:H+ antiporter-2